MSISEEKQAEATSNDLHVEHAGSCVEASTMCTSDDRVRKIRRKVDSRLCIIIAILYAVAQLDRLNLGYAVLAGMDKDIDLGNMNYSIIALLFFPTYILFQPLMTVMARKIGPRLFLTVICVAWGVVMLSFDFTHRWYQLAGLRVLLGLLEAGFFPYPNPKLQKLLRNLDIERSLWNPFSPL